MLHKSYINVGVGHDVLQVLEFRFHMELVNLKASLFVEAKGVVKVFTKRGLSLIINALNS